MLPHGIILSAGSSTAAEEAARQPTDPEAHATLPSDFEQEEADSRHGLGGYHGSIHPDEATTVYYAVGVFSEADANGENGIVAFGQPWKNVVATFYHELVEARTDADVGDAARTGESRLLGWYSLDRELGGEIGDIPINEAGQQGDPLSAVFQEVELADGSGTVPIQLMYSNAVDGPQGPIDQPTPPAA